MSEGFTKLFSSITDSTIWSEDNETRLVWITMLAMADRSGYVAASVPGLAARARVSLEATEKALEKFLSPDRYSRSPDHHGRRIEVADRGWTLLNHSRFRDMRDEEARKEYERVRKRDQRADMSRNVPDKLGQSRSVPQCLPQSAQAEAEAEADPRSDQSPRGGRRHVYDPRFEELWKEVGNTGNGKSLGNSVKFEAELAWKEIGRPTTRVAETWASYIASIPGTQTPKHFGRWLKLRCHEQTWEPLGLRQPSQNGEQMIGRQKLGRLPVA